MDINDSIEVEARNVIDEALRAHERYGDFTSTHEAFGVLAEEVAELLDAIKANKSKSIAAEARQVSAVSLRLAEICERENRLEAPEFGERSSL